MKRARRYRKKVLGDEEDEKDKDEDINEKLKLIKSFQKRKELNRLANEEKSSERAGTDVLDAYVKEKSITDTSETEQMEQFIKKQMMERSGKLRDLSNTTNYLLENSKEELFGVPDNLKTNYIADVAIPGLMTGITEVQLPLDVHLKNIEDTERAKYKILERSLGRNLESDSDNLQKDAVIKRNMFVSSFGQKKKKQKP